MTRTNSADWDRVAADPDPERDLGYRLADWDLVTANNGSDQLIFLPQDDELLKEDAFIVVEADAVCDVTSNL